jgi:transcriptional accessory protein Tex/SPT6
MVDPLALTIATNVATKIADTLTDQGLQAVASIVAKIREKFRSQSAGPSEIATLDAAITTGDALAAQALAHLLAQLFAADAQFREEIRELWDSAGTHDSVTNIFRGRADKVIMMRDVNGDLTIN